VKEASRVGTKEMGMTLYGVRGERLKVRLKFQKSNLFYNKKWDPGPWRNGRLPKRVQGVKWVVLVKTGSCKSPRNL